MNNQIVYVAHDENGFIKGFSMVSRLAAWYEARENGYKLLLEMTEVQCQHKKCYTDFDWCETLQDVEAEASTPRSVEDMVLEDEL